MEGSGAVCFLQFRTFWGGFCGGFCQGSSSGARFVFLQFRACRMLPIYLVCPMELCYFSLKLRVETPETMGGWKMSFLLGVGASSQVLC